ncbi:hypothetical protein TM48_01443 [Mycobacterium shottsii]|uniref:Uncharacterized protein n=1 Tax=Mycobacterium shottsii TaxID=133549 RepID=A0A7I7LC22_9MYCO|nr:hypothetical protein [Mycobacterium shottsii]QYL27241.1 hypothetical protein TM48_01443 [Mycobacterium shottsii]BBX56959.1 hypothetical protein MSHO_23040 [Mycobacterium shottsii]
MANVDWVIVGAGPSLTDITAAVQAATGSELVDGVLRIADDERASLRVYPGPAIDGGGHVVRIRYAGGPYQLQHDLARTVYDALVEGTDWDLVLDSDELEDIVATRIRSTPR